MAASELQLMVETGKGSLVSTLASQTPKLNLNLTQLSSLYSQPPSPCRSYNIEARDLSYKLTESSKRWFKAESRYILRDVNCRAKAWEVLAIAGPSGAGKSTLLELLAGRLNPACGNGNGNILVNGVASDNKQLRRISGYITQDDALFPFLTVEETLLFSANLRLRGSTDKDKRSRVRALLKDLRLDHVAGSKIGNDRIRGVSGGERRRVSIGVDVIHDPAVLLLDEPTSGLDSFSALQIIKIVKSMAELKGRTVILTIHQPGFRILELFNSILLLSKGSSLHQGSLAKLESNLVSAGCEIPPHVNILDYAMDAIGSLQVKTDNGIENIQGRVKVTLYDLFLINITETGGGGGAEDSQKREWLYEIWVLSHRFLLNAVRSKQLFKLKIMQAVGAGLCLGALFYQAEKPEERLGLLAFSLTFLLSCATEGLPIFVEEREILKRETYSGAYRVSSYVIANAIVFLPLMLAVSLLFSVPVYFLVGLNARASAFFYFVIVIWMGIYAANSLVALFSALVPNYIMGTTLITGCLGSFFLFSGFFVSKSDIPKYWMFMHYMSVFKYPLEALLINEYSGSEDTCLAYGLGKCVMNVGDVMEEQGLHETHRWTDLLIMLAFICLYRFLAFLALTWRCRCPYGL